MHTSNEFVQLLAVVRYSVRHQDNVGRIGFQQIDGIRAAFERSNEGLLTLRILVPAHPVERSQRSTGGTSRRSGQ